LRQELLIGFYLIDSPVLEPVKQQDVDIDLFRPRLIAFTNLGSGKKAFAEYLKNRN